MALSFEELPKDERPPKNIWLDGKKLEEWFKAVDDKRKREMEGKGIDDPVENDAAKSLLVE